MDILVTGSSGYLGGRLCAWLEANGHVVRRGTRQPRTPHEVVTDWADAASLGRACRGADAVVHLAGMNAAACLADPCLALEVNGVNTVRLIQIAERSGVKRFVYLSTIHVYGRGQGTLREDYLPQPLHPYATSHRAGEDVTLAAGTASGGMQGVVLRLSNAFGAPARRDADCWTLLVNDLCRQAVTLKTLRLHGNGMQRRDFIALTDACRGIGHALAAAHPLAADDRVYNLGGGWSPTLLEVAELVDSRHQALFGESCAIVRSSDKGDPEPPLDFVCERLARAGFVASTDRVREIDDLLVFCREQFGPAA